MKNFACLDDSATGHSQNLEHIPIEKRFFIYSHALILYNEDPEIIIFEGKLPFPKKEDRIIKYGSKLIDFIEKYLPKDYNLHACGHYREYPELSQIVDYWEKDTKKYFRGNDRMKIKKTFLKAHCTAKQTAQRRLDEMMENYINK